MSYGRLYTWEAAKQACSKLGNGWRLPTDKEWQELVQLYGGFIDMETRLYALDGSVEEGYQALTEGGISGFSLRMGGYKVPGSDGFRDLGDQGNYWSATEHHNNNLFYFGLNGDLQMLVRGNAYKSAGFSCRCVQDN